MGKYCCFFCPTGDYSEKILDQPCANCGRKYGFPLFDAPKSIKAFRIVKSLGRGFYAATFVAESGALNRKSVLKVSPKEFFSFFNKDFSAECKTHAAAAEGTEHIVGIHDMLLDVDISFGDVVVPCHVAELAYVNGKLLADYLKPEAALSATTAAQIAIDLFKIRDELQKKNLNHNDLHAENIIVASLGADARRAGAIDDSIRAVAIDLGSISDGSKSDSEKLRLGDLHWIAEHLRRLVHNLLRDPDTIDDLGNRLASALQLIVHSISATAENQRTPSSEDFIAQIEEAYYRVTQHWRPWRQRLTLKSFSSAYNAQTMHAWHVPYLLVDPDGQWLNSISSPGPQVITGMRGCGKTMLIRALQFHARATQKGDESNDSILGRLKNDNYVGLFVSAQRLLDRPGEVPHSTRDPFARLFIAYGLEAIRAVHHLRDINNEAISKHAHKNLADVIARHLDTSINLVGASSEYDLESRLNNLLIDLSRDEHDGSLTVHPNAAFPMLADAIRQCSPIWEGAQVLFLLDDVSTRYLNQQRIEHLLSALLFQNPSCAFKLTSEAQTIELGLKSPGENHPARVGRDLSVFDLGAEVYEKIKKPGRGNGRDFVEKILIHRAEHFAAHPSVPPGTLLGDVPLEKIAVEIGNSLSNSGKRKEVYRGITALARMCVGDIGDVISLYEQILKSATGKSFPISPKIQSECFQDFCARRLYDLNRRGGYLKDVAKSFAEASHDLLVKSCKAPSSKKGRCRVRQYSSLYVRITTGDLEKQTEQLRELIDAGVFVFAGGSNAPRTKTRDSNPTQQFKLTYRKIYGLVNFIGLAERDRFELSGSELEDWLGTPSKGKEILLRNLGGNEEDEVLPEDAECLATQEGRGSDPKIDVWEKSQPSDAQISFFEEGEVVPPIEADQSPDLDVTEAALVLSRKPLVEKISASDMQKLEIDCVVVGLGFEERSLISTKNVCSTTAPRRALAIKYKNPGRSAEIDAVLRDSIPKITTVDYGSVIQHGLPSIEGNVVVDITGLAKPVIFYAVRNELRRKRRVWICHTEAEEYYPLDDDLQEILSAIKGSDRNVLFEKLRGILFGEKGPYQLEKLLPMTSDETRQRVLCAFSSPKHERLFSLLDSRAYDRIEVVAPEGASPRSKIAQIAAEIADRNNANSAVTNIESNNIDGVMEFISERYKYWYIDRGMNFEFGLTGSKLQAVACAAASAAFKISQTWYLRPQEFDPDRFTRGVGETHFYEIFLQDKEAD